MTLPACRCSLALLSLALAVPGAPQAADADGLYMVKGGGRAECRRFLGAQQARNAEFVSFAGYVDGYVSALNRTGTETYDLVPWQSTELLLSAIARWCKANPDQSFHDALVRMTDTLVPQRLVRKSELVEARVGERSVLLYRETLRNVQARLRERGHLEGEPSGTFDEATRKAIEAFQAAKQLTVTGLPDQVTLGSLL